MNFDTYSKFTESLNEKLNIMYVHGYNSDMNSSTSAKLKIALSNKISNFNWFSPSIQNDPISAIHFVEKFVKLNKIDVVIGSSLGGFNVLHSYLPNVTKILINPLIDPSFITVDSIINDKIFSQCQKMFNESPLAKGKSLGTNNKLIGIFSTADEVIDPVKNLSLFKLALGNSKNPLNVNTINDKHIPLNLDVVANIIAESVSSFNESVVSFNESFNTDLSIPFDLDEDLQNEYDENKLVYESFVNVFSREDKMIYLDRIVELLNLTYAPIGGYLGRSDWKTEDLKEDILENDMIKLWRSGGKIICGATYKFKGGRKSTGLFHDGTSEGKSIAKKILHDDFRLKDRDTWAEVSGAPAKILSQNEFAIPLPAIYVEELLKKPIKIVDEFHYIREIGGSPMQKMIYVSNMKIK